MKNIEMIEKFTEQQKERDEDLKREMSNRDKNLKLKLIEREKAWMSNWQHCKHSLNMTFAQASNTNTMLTSIGKRQRELVEANANILDWARPKKGRKLKRTRPHTIS